MNKRMAIAPTCLRDLAAQCHESNDEGRDQLFADLYKSYYDGRRATPADLAGTLKAFILSLDVLPTTAGAETIHTPGRRPGPLRRNTTVPSCHASWG